MFATMKSPLEEQEKDQTLASRHGCPLHPTLKKLGLSPTSKKVGPSPLDVLNYLLSSKLLEETHVEAAYKAVHEMREKEDEDMEKVATQTKADIKKEFDENKKHRTRHVALRFYYDGADYSGLAENIGYAGDQSIEKALFAGLKKTNLIEARESCHYSRCGRTDKGVSSAGQVVGVYLKSIIALDATWDQEGTLMISDEDLPRNSIEKIKVWVLPKKGNGPRVVREVAELPYDKILNNVLPNNIRILGWCPVSPDFNARFSCTTRTYRYFFNPRQLNLTKMTQGLQLMVGNHDFRNFCKMDVEKVYNFERKIHHAAIVKSETEDVYYFEIMGQAFLWHQIRCIVSVLFMIGRGEEDPCIVQELLDVSKHPGKPSYPLAPERPLVLHNCGFHNLSVGYDCHNIWSLSCQMEQQWEEFSLSAARVRNCIESFSSVSVLRADLVQFARVRLQERFTKQRQYSAQGNQPLQDCLEHLEEGLPLEATVTWEESLMWMAKWKLVPAPDNRKIAFHVPLLQRSKGTTYEEKVESLQQSSKRKQKYEENVIKKRKTKEEDHAFYVHMAKQGGSAM